MTDPFANMTDATDDVQTKLGEVLEVRAAIPQQRRMLEMYLGDVDFPQGAQVLDIGCGTGAVTRVLAGWPNVATVVGVDPAPGLLAQARALSADYTNISFEAGDGRALPFSDASFDVVVLHTVLCHVPGPEQCVEEAFRLLRPGGWVAIFDNDPMTATVATGAFDPLQACVEANATIVTNTWIARRVAAMVQSVGFHLIRQRSHGSVETTEGYFVTILDRGADLLVAQGRIGAALAEALKAEARRRIAAGTFFGHFAYVSLVAQKPID